jgi:hypothetical protein
MSQSGIFVNEILAFLRPAGESESFSSRLMKRSSTGLGKKTDRQPAFSQPDLLF